MKRLLAISFLLSIGSVYAQTVFFTSPETYDKEQLSPFYASLSLQGDHLLYNAPDYRLYAYMVASQQPVWSYDLKFKSNLAPFKISDSSLWANSKTGVMQLALFTGALQKENLPFQTVETAPFQKEGILYATGNYDGGCLFAYDPEKIPYYGPGF